MIRKTLFAVGFVLLLLTWWIPLLNLLTIPLAGLLMLPGIVRFIFRDRSVEPAPSGPQRLTR